MSLEQGVTPTAANAALRCPKCGHENSEVAHFCAYCHYVLIRRCPKCWHEQRAGGVCENCGTDMNIAWKVQGVTAQAALMKEEETNVESSAKQAIQVVETVAQASMSPASFLAFLGLRYLFSWLKRRWPSVLGRS